MFLVCVAAFDCVCTVPGSLKFLIAIYEMEMCLFITAAAQQII